MPPTYDPDYDWIMSPSDPTFDQHMTDAPAMQHTKTMTITWWRRPDPDDPGASSEAEHWSHRHRQPCHLPLPCPGQPRNYIFSQWYTTHGELRWWWWSNEFNVMFHLSGISFTFTDIEYSIHRNALHCGFHNWRRGLTETPWQRLPSTISFNLITISHKH